MLCPIETRRPTQVRHPMVLSQNKHRSSSHVLHPQRPSFKNLLQRHYHQNRPLAAWPPCANNSISQNRRPRSRRRSPHQQANLHPRQHLRTTLNDRHHSLESTQRRHGERSVPRANHRGQAGRQTEIGGDYSQVFLSTRTHHASIDRRHPDHQTVATSQGRALSPQTR